MPQRRYLSPGGPAFDGTNSSSGDALEPKSSSRARGPGTPEAAPDQPPPGRGRTGPGDGAGSVSETRTQRPCRSAPDPCQPQGWLKAFVLPVGSSLPSSCRPGALSPGGLCKRRSLGVAQCLTRQVWGEEREGTFLPGPGGLGEPLEKHGPRRWARSPGCSWAPPGGQKRHRPHSGSRTPTPAERGAQRWPALSPLDSRVGRAGGQQPNSSSTKHQFRLHFGKRPLTPRRGVTRSANRRGPCLRGPCREDRRDLALVVPSFSGRPGRTGSGRREDKAGQRPGERL